MTDASQWDINRIEREADKLTARVAGLERIVGASLDDARAIEPNSFAARIAELETAIGSLRNASLYREFDESDVKKLSEMIDRQAETIRSICKERDDLRAKYDSMETDRDRYRHYYDNACSQIREWRHKAELAESVNKLSACDAAECERLRKDRDEYKRLLDNAGDDCGEVMKERDSWRNTYLETAKQHELLKSDHAALRTEYDKLRLDREQDLRDNYAAHNARQAALDELTAVRKENKVARNDIQRLTELITTHSGEIERLEKLNAAYQAESGELTREIRSLAEERDGWRYKCEEIQSTYNDLFEWHANAVSECERWYLAFQQAHNTDCGSEYERLRRENSELRHKCELMEPLIQSHDKEFTAACQQRDEYKRFLDKALAEATDWQHEYTFCRKAKDEMEAEIANLNTQLRRMKDTLKSCTESL